MSARVYFMKRVKDCKNVSIMAPQDEKLRLTSLLCYLEIIHRIKHLIVIESILNFFSITMHSWLKYVT